MGARTQSRVRAAIAKWGERNHKDDGKRIFFCDLEKMIPFNEFLFLIGFVGEKKTREHTHTHTPSSIAEDGKVQKNEED